LITTPGCGGRAKIRMEAKTFLGGRQK